MTKKILGVMIAIALFVSFSFVFTSCRKKEILPWDSLGGGGVGTDIPEISAEKSDDYLYADETWQDTSSNIAETPSGDEFIINLNNFKETDNETDLYKYIASSGVLTINKPGIYELSGTLNGSIEVEKSIGEVVLILNNVTINTNNSTSGILIGKDEGVKKTITVKSGTSNMINISDETETLDADAAITAKTCNLVINGSGTLNINANTNNEYSGIKAKYLTIDATSLNINANKNGINSEFEIYIKNNANLNVTALGDGIKTDIEPKNEQEATNYASNIKYGYIYIQNSNITINAGSSSDYTSSNHGISANNCLYIDNTLDYTINVTTNGGAPTTITETLSDMVAGKALRADGIEYNDESMPAGYESNYAVVILGGNFILNSCSDAITSAGNLIISGGEFDIKSGDDGIHAEYLTKILNGNIAISKCYEGIEGAVVEIYDGTISITSTDDAINAANADLSNYTYYIYIAGGTININASGDGIDSNGTIKLIGGNIYVNGPTSGGNAALDADSGILTNGGNIIALGTKDMVETPSTNSTQCFINLTCSATISAGTIISVTDSNSSVIFTYTTTKSFQSVIISLDAFELNSSYKISVGSTTYSTTLSSIATALGSNASNKPSGRR